MASEIGHVIYAARVLTNLGDAVKHPTYWSGTLFPNIYHIGATTRHTTHPDKVSLYSLVGSDDFITGLRVHAWIDATRDQFFGDQHAKERLPWHPLTRMALSLLEDQLLYGHFDDWNLIHRSLNNIDSHEFSFQPERSTINLWHTAVQDYLIEPPSDKSRQELLVRKGISKHIVSEINDLVMKLGNNKAATELLFNFWRHLEDVLQ